MPLIACGVLGSSGSSAPMRRNSEAPCAGPAGRRSPARCRSGRCRDPGCWSSI